MISSSYFAAVFFQGTTRLDSSTPWLHFISSREWVGERERTQRKHASRELCKRRKRSGFLSIANTFTQVCVHLLTSSVAVQGKSTISTPELKRPSMRDGRTPPAPPSPIFMIFTPEVRFGPKPTKTHLSMPRGPEKAPKHTVVARYFLQFFYAFFTWQH